MNRPYVPLSRRRDPAEAAAYVETLFDSIPSWLRESVWQWVDRHMGYNYGRDGVYRGVRGEYTRAIERACQLDLGWDGKVPTTGLDRVRSLLANSPGRGLDVVEFISHDYADESGRVSLDKILREGGSKWRVRTSDGLFELRVAEVATTAVEDVEGRPGELLRAAWGAVYGRNPSPSEGYRQAVRAVEAAGKEVVSPENVRTTLGTIIRDLRNGAQKFELTLSSGAVRPVPVLIDMLSLLWTNQYDRHVTESRPLHVSQEEAEAAVTLAITLVQWFVRGHISRAA